MAKEIGKLTPVGVKALKEPGRYSDGANLYVVVSKTGAKTWSFIYRWRGRQREAGFGSVGALRLKEARERAQEGRALIVKGPAGRLAGRKAGEERPGLRRGHASVPGKEDE
jgi:hypothetical protein